MPMPMPINRELQDQAVAQYRGLPTMTDRVLSLLLETVAARFEVDFASVSLLDSTEQIPLCMVGTPPGRAPREQALCGHTAMQNEPLVVLDATRDDRFAHNPLVVQAQGIRFYAGCPLRTPDGVTIGSLCLVGRRPRASFSRALVVDLATFGEMAMSRLNELRQAQMQKQLDRTAAQERVLAMVAHELKGPLTAVIGYSALLRQSVADTDQRDWTDAVLQASGQAYTLVDRVLEYASLLQGDISLREDVVALADLLAEARSQSGPAFLARSVDLVSEAEPSGADLTLRCDKAHMLQALAAILVTAVAAVPAGGEVRLSMSWQPPEGLTISIRGLHDGPEPQVRPEAGGKDSILFRNAEGQVDLGLPMARLLVEAHGARIEALEASGSEVVSFGLTLPFWRVIAT